MKLIEYKALPRLGAQRLKRRVGYGLICLGIFTSAGLTNTPAQAQDSQNVTVAEAKKIVRLVQVQLGEGLFDDDDNGRVLEDIRLIESDNIDDQISCDPFDPSNPCISSDTPTTPTDPSDPSFPLGCVGQTTRLFLSNGPPISASFSIFLDPPGNECTITQSFDPGAAIGGSVFVANSGRGQFLEIFVDGDTSPGTTGFAFVCDDPPGCIHLTSPSLLETVVLTRREVSTGFRVRFTLVFEPFDSSSSFMTVANVEIL